MKAKKPSKDRFSKANGEGYPAGGKEGSTAELCTMKEEAVEERLMKEEEGRRIALIQSSQHLNDVSNRMSTPT